MQINPGLSVITRNTHPYDHITDVGSVGWIPVVAGAVAAVAGLLKKKKKKAPPPPPKSNMGLIIGGGVGILLVGGLLFMLSKGKK